MNKILLYPFREDPLCFVHVLLNALNMHSKGMGGLIVLEGGSVTLVQTMADPGHFLHQLYRQAREKDLILGACRACATKLKAVEAIQKENIPLIGDMSGHPAMSDYIEQGYTILTF